MEEEEGLSTPTKKRKRNATGISSSSMMLTDRIEIEHMEMPVGRLYADETGPLRDNPEAVIPNLSFEVDVFMQNTVKDREDGLYAVSLSSLCSVLYFILTVLLH